MSLEIENIDITCYEIDETGTIAIEKSNDEFILRDEESLIDLSRPIEIKELKIIQDNVIIDMKVDYQLKYFKQLLEDLCQT